MRINDMYLHCDNLSLVCVQEAAALLAQLTDASFPRKMDLDAGDLPWRDFKRGCACAAAGPSQIITQ